MLPMGTMHAITCGTVGKPLLLWIHGSPGSWTAWKGLMQDSALSGDYFHIAVDRPGFGYSMQDSPVASLKTQSELLYGLLDSLKFKGNYIGIGHSMGGPVLARMAIDQPDRFKAIILVAPALDPDLEVIHWYNTLASKAWFNWWLPKEMITSNEEMIPLKEQLQLINNLYGRISCKVLVLQGMKDQLVNPENELFARKKMLKAPVEVWLDPNEGHLIPWTQPALIRQAIYHVRD